MMALTAVRWPSLLMIMVLLGEGGILAEISGLMNWRELGLTYGVIYLIAAFFFYATSTLIARRGRGSVISYVLGTGIGFPPFLFFDFEAGWWQNPDPFEQSVLFAATLTVILFGAVIELSGKSQRVEGKPARPKEPKGALVPETVILPAHRAPIADAARRREPVSKARVYKPVPAAIARQRASFAAHGRRARARQLR